MPKHMTTTIAGAAFAALALASAQPALAKAKPEISYYLPRTDVTVTVTMTLLSCPEKAGEMPGIDTQWTVAGKGVADPARLVRVDVSSGFLAKRSNAFEFYPNGTLAQFNGSSEGQGGAFIGSVLKAAGAVAPLLNMGAGGRPNVQSSDLSSANTFYCSDDVLGALSDLASIRAEIRQLEDKVVRGTATTADLDLLERRRAKRAAIVKSLTIVKGVTFDRTTISGDDDRSGNWFLSFKIPKLQTDWFAAAPGKGKPIAFDKTKIVGLDGYGVTINPVDRALLPKPATPPNVATPSDAETLPPLQRSIVYRVPVHAKVVVRPTGCTGDDCDETLDLDGPLPIGQWGTVRELPVGSAGIFGSRQASASFDEFGTPLKLSYGSDSGAASIGTTIETAGGTATSIADASTSQLERQVKKQELENKLRDLQAGE